jgi:hypothetical protein
MTLICPTFYDRQGQLKTKMTNCHLTVPTLITYRSDLSSLLHSVQPSFSHRRGEPEGKTFLLPPNFGFVADLGRGRSPSIR